jgi:PAS domain S-box-containing protein
MYPTDDGLAVYFRDITERKRDEAVLLQAKEEAERRAREAEEAQSILHTILDNAPIGITLAGGPPEFPIIANSKRAATMIGRRSDTLLNIPAGAHGEAYGLLLPNGTHPQPEQLPLYRASRYGELIENEEWILERPDGSRICELSNVAPIRDYHGRIIGAIDCWHDVTAQKREQESLRASEERFRRYFDLGLIGMATTSPAKGFVEVNDELCRIFGYERAELLSMNWVELTYPDDVVADVEQFNRVMSGAIRGYSMDKRWIRKDGGIIHSIMAVQCVRRADEAVDFFVALVQDITERKIWEERLRRSEALLSAGQRISHTGSWVWNVVTDGLFWSDEHFRICGVDPNSFTLTRETARQLIHPDDRAATDQAYEAAKRDTSVFERQFRMVRPDGSVRFVFSLGYPVFDEAGELAEYVGTIMDITDRKESEAMRDELLRRLVAAQEDERRRIAIEMHDQFGQQLSALVLKLAGLRHEQGRRTNLGQQLASLEEMTRRLDTDLELIVWRLRPPSLDDLGLIAALAHYVERWSEHFGVRAELQSSGLDGGVIDDIDTALYRIAQEALNNVAKHAQAKSVAVHLDRRADRVSLIVEDDGIGFQAEQRMGARQRFGLVGMRERATLLGGTLDIESRPGSGTTVAVRIPLSPYQQERARDQAPRHSG